MASNSDSEPVEVEELLLRPGTYFNPQTEVVVIVDDSASIDRSALDLGGYEGSGWVRLSEAAPIDEQALDETLEEFQTRLEQDRPGARTALEADEDDIEDTEDALQPPARLPPDDDAEDEAVDEIADRPDGE